MSKTFMSELFSTPPKYCKTSLSKSLINYGYTVEYIAVCMSASTSRLNFIFNPSRYSSTPPKKNYYTKIDHNNSKLENKLANTIIHIIYIVIKKNIDTAMVSLI